MAYTPPSTINDLLVSWNATYSISGGFAASLKIRNPNKVIDSNALRWTPIDISTAATVTSYAGTVDTQYIGTTSWATGIVSHVNETESLVEGDEVLEIHLTSYFDRVRDRPVNTETYSASLSTIIAAVLTEYGGVPATLYSVATGHNATYNGAVQGDSLLSEVELLARAAWADAYIQVGGALEIKDWRDAGSSVDYTLTDEAVLDNNYSRTIEKSPTLIYIRGGYQSLLGCGLRVISSEPTIIPASVKRSRCLVPGAESISVDMALKNIEGNKETIQNAGFLLDGDTKFDSLNIPKDGESGHATLTVKPTVTGTAFPSGALQTTDVLVVSKSNERDVNTGASSRGKGALEREKKRDRFTSRLTGTSPGAVAGIPTLATDQTSDSADKSRLNFGLLDSTLAGDYGVVNGSVDNPYITNSLVAFRAAIREFQETRMKRLTYQLKTVYIPVLRLNHVITFKDKAGNSITGRIIELRVSHGVATAETTMDLTVESFADLGSLSYQSDNLLVYPELCGINGVDWAVTSGDVWAMGSGFFAFDGPGAVEQSMTLIPGLTYTVSFTLTMLTATGSFLAFLGGSSPPTMTSSGTYSFTANPLTESNTLIFQATFGEWLLSDPSVTVTASGF